MRWSVFICLVTGCANTNNAPQYVGCIPDGRTIDTCHLEAGTMDVPDAKGSLHVPLKPEALWRARDRAVREELQMTMPDGIEVPVFRLDHYDLEVEWTVTNLDAMPGQFRVDLNGANEAFTYDPSMLAIGEDDEAPSSPPLAGNIPIDISANGTVTGVFREDQLLEAAIDLDQVSRGNVNPFAASLTISKNAATFQPLTPSVYDPQSGQVTPGIPMGPEVPRAAFRQIVRVDIVFRPQRHMTIDYTLRVREHTEIIHEMGLAAPSEELEILDPPPYVP